MKRPAQASPKVIRTALYGDQKIHRWELRLLHTPILQRLYDLKQLGFADRVFPDAIHSRLNHVLGVMEVADRMISAIRNTPYGPSPSELRKERLPSDTELLEALPVLRLAALLHDITHIPFGHTLEDEVCVFPTRHEDRARQIEYFNTLCFQFIKGVATAVSPHAFAAPDPEDIDVAEAIPAMHANICKIEERSDVELLEGYSDFCSELHRSLILLLAAYSFENAKPDDIPPKFSDQKDLALTAALGARELALREDFWMIDAIGNTICADLLDYARRDIRFTGMVAEFDDRLYRYLTVQRIDGVRRLVIRIFTDKIRLDVLSEILNVLKVRYLLSERVLFHPAKCAAGAMLGRAAELLKEADSDASYSEYGDRELLREWRARGKQRQRLLTTLLDFAEAGGSAATVRELRAHLQSRGERRWFQTTLQRWIESDLLPMKESAQSALKLVLEEVGVGRLLVQLRTLARRPSIQALLPTLIDRELQDAAAVVRLIDGLLARQYFKPVYQVTRQAAEAHRLTAENISAKYSVPEIRSGLQRRVEGRLGLPPGTVIVYCPRPKTTLKEARVLVSWSRTEPPKPFNELKEVPAFQSFCDESASIEAKYRDIWSLLVFVPECYLPVFSLIQRVIYEELRVESSQLLQARLEKDPRARRLAASVGEIDEMHLRALSRTVNQAEGAELGAAAKYGEFPDFLSAYHAELEAIVAEKGEPE